MDEARARYLLESIAEAIANRIVSELNTPVHDYNLDIKIRHIAWSVIKSYKCSPGSEGEFRDVLAKGGTIYLGINVDCGDETIGAIHFRIYVKGYYKGVPVTDVEALKSVIEEETGCKVLSLDPFHYSIIYGKMKCPRARKLKTIWLYSDYAVTDVDYDVEL